jgi:hypothetical protein
MVCRELRDRRRERRGCSLLAGSVDEGERRDPRRSLGASVNWIQIQARATRLLAARWERQGRRGPRGEIGVYPTRANRATSSLTSDVATCYSPGSEPRRALRGVCRELRVRGRQRLLFRAKGASDVALIERRDYLLPGADYYIASSGIEGASDAAARLRESGSGGSERRRARMCQQRWTLFRTARAVTWLRSKGQNPNKRRERRGTNRATWLLAFGSPSQPAACKIPSSIILYGN